jgi:uncharacterized protein YecE (DUF72 family)
VRVRAGTSGFSYPTWRGSFYPDDLQASEMLRFYARHLPTVEIDSTFYRLPSAETLARWSEQVPRGFVFAVKAPRRITHLMELVGVGDVLAGFLRRASELGERLGPILFQLPPSLREDPRLLDAFLELLPRELKAAFEFRHASWYRERVAETLAAHHKAFCIAETDEHATPLWATADWGYLRLRRRSYTPSELHVWVERIRAQPWKEAYVFFKHEEVATGPVLAQNLLDLAEGDAVQLRQGR